MANAESPKLRASGYELRLYIAGTTPRSLSALENIRRVCSEELAGRCSLNVIDIYEEPEMARTDQILAVPTLVKRSPAPARVVVGDLSDYQALLKKLDINS